MYKTLIAATLIAAWLVGSAEAANLSVSFRWGKTPACHTGNPSVIGSPAFTIGRVPKGTRTLRFLMTDLDARGYYHGGGSVPYRGKNAIPAGSFRYKGPCPPSGSHTYSWSVEALDAGGKVLARGAARRRFP